MWKREIEMSANPSESKKTTSPSPGKYVYRSNDGEDVIHKFFEITEENNFHVTHEEFKTITKVFKIEKSENVIFLKRMGQK